MIRAAEDSQLARKAPLRCDCLSGRFVVLVRDIAGDETRQRAADVDGTRRDRDAIRCGPAGVDRAKLPHRLVRAPCSPTARLLGSSTNVHTPHPRPPHTMEPFSFASSSALELPVHVRMSVVRSQRAQAADAKLPLETTSTATRSLSHSLRC